MHMSTHMGIWQGLSNSPQGSGTATTNLAKHALKIDKMMTHEEQFWIGWGMAWRIHALARMAKACGHRWVPVTH